jgi:hypothetical protein
VLELLANVLMLAGGFTAVIGGTLGNLILFRYLRAPAGSDRKQRSLAALKFAYSLSQSAALAAMGLVILLVGAAVGFGVPIWAPALPAGMLAGAVASAWYARRLARRLSNSA